LILCPGCRWRQLRRHRLFVSNVWLMGAGGCHHGRAPVIGVYGDGAQRGTPRVGSRGGDPYRGNVVECRTALGIDWMTRRQLSLSIPPLYTEHIGWQLLDALYLCGASA
jgi:DNA (cytosine-5)-methyltransferase 1